MATLNTNYTLLLNNYIGNFGGVNAYLRVYAKIERQDLVNNKSYVAIKEVIYASADYIYSGNNTYYLNSNIGNSGTKSSGFTFNAGETLINTVYAWAHHNNDGTFTLTGSAGFTSQAWGMGTSGNYSATLPTIPRGSKINDFSGSFNLGDPLTFSITKNVASYYDVLQIGFIKDDTSEYVLLDTVENVLDGYVWNATDDMLNTIYTNTPTQNSRTLTFRLSTYTDSTKATQIGDTNENTIKGMIVNANPTLTSFNYEDVNSKTIALTGNSSKIVKGYSTLHISDLVCNANKGATLQLIQINDIQYPYSENFTINIENWASNNITIYVIDSRNNSTKLETLIGINFINYTEKTITNKSCLRDGSINEESVLSFSGTFFNSSFGAVNNTLNASYKYKETSSTEWINGNTTLTLTINNNNFNYEGYIKGDTNTGFSADKSFDIQIIITDLLSERAITLILAVGEPAIDIYKSNVAFGGIYDELESEYQAQFKKAVNFENGIYINGEKFDVIDSLNSESTTDALSANMGKELNEKLNYSTEEKIIGTWIDGKPIYRKVVQYNKQSTGGVNINLSDFGITNVENIWLNNNSFVKSVNNEFKPVNNLESIEVFSFCNFPSTTQIRLSTNNHYLTGMWNLIIEYTKITN